MGMLDFLGKTIGEGAAKVVESVKNEAAIRIKKETQKFEERITKRISATMITFLGVILVTIGLAFLIIDYLKISRTITFITLGIIILLVGIIKNLTTKNQ
ncbi:MAG: hypothetical protein AABW73_01555 [Nanoarchaeota archaeon]